jgi:cobalt transporter subunit CbtB
MTREPGDLPQREVNSSLRLPMGQPGGTHMSASTTTGAASSYEASSRLIAAVLFIAGLALVYLVGFSHSTTLHNAAHDSRHALAFPCH